MNSWRSWRPTIENNGPEVNFWEDHWTKADACRAVLSKMRRGSSVLIPVELQHAVRHVAREMGRPVRLKPAAHRGTQVSLYRMRRT